MSSDSDDNMRSLVRENKRLREQVTKYINKNQVLLADIHALTTNQRKTKKQIRQDNEWDGDDANIADTVSSWVKTDLFPRYKFLTSGWMRYNSEDKKSLSSFVQRKLCLEEFGDDEYKDMWNRVLCPTINSKYATIRNNLNNEVRKCTKVSHYICSDYVLMC